MGMNRRWVKTKAVFAGELQGLGIEESIDDRLAPFRFDLNEVVAYNESSIKDFATIWLNGTSITITMSVNELDREISG